MVKFEDDVNVNIYNLYHNKMLKKRTQYVYVFYYNDENPYEIRSIKFDEIEEFYNVFKDKIFTIETRLDEAIKHAEKNILESLRDNTGNLTGDVKEEIELVFRLDNFKKSNLYSIDYVYNPFMQGYYTKMTHQMHYIKQ